MQQFSFIDLFIDLFQSALHVSVAKLSHLQEHFLTAYTAVVQCTDIAADRTAAISVHCTRAVYAVKKCSWRRKSLATETCRADWNRSI